MLHCVLKLHPFPEGQGRNGEIQREESAAYKNGGIWQRTGPSISIISDQY